MPTPVSLARQCLTPEAAHALDEAVAVARRRGHAQTTSLHAVSALLSLPSSALRDACARARNSAYSTRIQFKALELCLSVSLDRQPSAQRVDDPPVSNSLMAAIKRSQANQRRQPENFHIYQQMQQQSSMSCVKVELQHLILSILDDPVVSRVFGEAGFRSCDIKLAIVRPLPQLLRYPRARGPPLFLCNLTGDSDPGRRSFSFPFSGLPGIFDGDEDSKRIGEVLARSRGRNPLLVGVCANDALRSFAELVERRKVGVLPVELSGLSVICIENELLNYVTENYDEELVNSRFEEVGRIAEHCSGPGLVVNYGDLKMFIGDDVSVDAVGYVVTQLTKLLEVHGRRVWLLGAAESYETYLTFISRLPSIEKDWDLQLLPITSHRASVGQPCSRSSLMESFVPFGGFFSIPSGSKGPLSGSYQCPSRCHICNEKCEQEVTALSKGVFTASVADQYQSSLPSWLQMADFGTNKGMDVVKAKDDGMVLSAKIAGLQKKWDNICQRLHHTQAYPESDMYQMGSQIPVVVGLQFVKNRKESAENHSSNNMVESPNKNGGKNEYSCLSAELQKISSSKPNAPFPVISISQNKNVVSKLWEEPSGAENPDAAGHRCSCSLSNSSVGDGQTSPPSATSVTTDLGLGVFIAPTSNELKPVKQTHIKGGQDLSGCISTNVDLVNESDSHCPAQSSSGSCLDFIGQFDQRDFKALSRALSERISWQTDAINAISQRIARCRTSNEKRHGATPRGDVWFNFLGPDCFGKKKIAVALAEILHGSRENFICVDLSSQYGMINVNEIFTHHDMNGYHVKFRGKTVVDYVAGELSKKPLSIVLLENVDKADLLVQNSLSHAIKTGKFPDSHGREVGSNNAIFMMTSRWTKGNKILSSGKEPTNYSEERILRAKSWSMEILIECALRGNNTINHGSKVSVAKFSPIFMNKRKLTGSNDMVEQRGTLEMAKRAHKASNMYLDLNLPAEENEILDSDYGHSDDDSISENPKTWLDNFLDLVDETVIFKPFDFDTLAKKIMKDISACFHKIVSLDCLLEIDSKVMELILAAACLSDRHRVVEDWVEQVLSKAFAEAQERYNLPAQTLVKLVTCKETSLGEQTPGVHLPTRIFLNQCP